MIFDITLKENRFTLQIHKKFFEHEWIESFRQGNNLTEKTYLYCGTFIVAQTAFGFDGCLKYLKEDPDYTYFYFDFPAQSEKFLEYQKKTVTAVVGDNNMLLHKFLVTIHLMHHYVLEGMHYDKVLFDTDAWNDQSISFQMTFEGGRCGKSVGGFMYKWTKEKLAGLDTTALKSLENYVHEEIKRFHLYFEGQEIAYEQVNFSNGNWYIQSNMDGRWASWKSGFQDKNDFSSHNIDFKSDQATLFAGIVAMNTWLREH